MNGISVSTIVRTLCLVLALVNQFLSAAGKPIIPIENETLEALLTAGITTVVAIINWWKNANFSTNAIEAQKVKNALDKKTITTEEVASFLGV